jgi:hypothetical protein
MQVIIRAADIQDRDGGMLLKGSLFGLYPFLLKLYADSGYQGPSSGRTACRLRPSQPGNRQAIRPPQVRRAAEAVDRRVNDRLAEPMLTAGQGLGMPEPLRARLPALGFGPHHAPKMMPKHQMISDGILG